MAEIGVTADNPPTVSNIATVKDKIENMTVNLAGPVLVNLREQKAAQWVIEKTQFPTRYPLFYRRGRKIAMLVLTRKPGERLVIGDNIVVTVVDVKGDNIRIGIDAPREVKVYRGEIYDAIVAENRRGGGCHRRPDRPRPTEGLPEKEISLELARVLVLLIPAQPLRSASGIFIAGNGDYR